MNNPLESVNPSSLSVFDFHSQSVRLLTRNQEPWFVAKDVCSAVEIGNSRQALSRLDDDEKMELPYEVVVTLNDDPNTTRLSAVSESGMYALVLSSRKPSAKAFRKWVTSEVLPAIRKTGSYFQPQPDADPIAPTSENLASTIQNLKLQIAQQPDIYRLIFSSRLKEATNFQQWVFEHVLPAVCQTGTYSQLTESEFAPIARALPSKEQPPIDLSLLLADVDRIFGVTTGAAEIDPLLTAECKLKALRETISSCPKNAKFLVAVEGAIELAEISQYLNTDQIAKVFDKGARVSLTKPRYVDWLLARCGYQEKKGDRFALTELGAQYGRVRGDRLYWSPRTVPILIEELDAL